MILAGEPVVGEVQVDPGRLDRGVTGLGLDGFEFHAGFSQPGQTGVAKLMTGGSLQAGPVAGAAHDRVDAIDRQRLAAGRSFSVTNTRSVGAFAGRSERR